MRNNKDRKRKTLRIILFIQFLRYGSLQLDVTIVYDAQATNWKKKRLTIIHKNRSFLYDSLWLFSNDLNVEEFHIVLYFIYPNL